MVDDMDHQQIIEERKENAERERWLKKTGEDINRWARLKEIKIVDETNLRIFIISLRDKGFKVSKKKNWLRVENDSGDSHSIRINIKTQRERVLSVFEEYPQDVMTVTKISELTNIRKSSVGTYLTKMRNVGEIEKVASGQYRLKESEKKEQIKDRLIPKKDVSYEWLQNITKSVYQTFDKFTLQVSRDDHKLVMILEAPL